ncbi:MAG: ABC transporter permease [Chloroflexi bacterium]|nr:ABC transporter permease [Chloroflexota bacterium]
MSVEAALTPHPAVFDVIAAVRARRSVRLAPAVFIVGVLTFLFAPGTVVVLFSFNASPRLAFPFEGITLDWYAAAFSNARVVRAFTASLIAALVTGIVASLLGTAFAMGMIKLRAGVRGLALTVALLPAIVPPLLLGISLTVFFNGIGQRLGLATAIAGHVLVALPFVVLTMNARLELFDLTVLEAARDLGASSWRAFRDVTLPLIRPAVIGGALLAMALSLDEFVVTFFTIGSDQTMPVLIWGMMRRGIDPTVNAIATMIITAMVILAALANRASRLRL